MCIFSRKFLLVAVLLGICLFRQASDMNEARSTAPTQSSAVPDDANQLWRQTVMCGPNSLYMLLALYDIPVDHQIIEKYIPSHREGMSLAELREASNTLGLRAEVRRCSIDELCRQFQSPVIAYVKAFNGPSQWNGTHYVVVIGITNDSVTILDGTTGKMGKFPRKWLKDFWLGYVLVPISDSSNPWILLAVSLCGWLLLVFWALKPGFVPCVKISDGMTWTSYCLIVVLIVLAASAFSEQTTAMASQLLGGQEEKDRDRAAYYRRPENDAVNCLYLQLRLRGYRESYEAFRKQLPDEPRSLSLQSLANLGRKFGFRLVPVKLTVAEIARARMPVIV